MHACEERIVLCSRMSVSGYILGLVGLMLFVVQVFYFVVDFRPTFSIHYLMVVMMYPTIIILLHISPFNFVSLTLSITIPSSMSV